LKSAAGTLELEQMKIDAERNKFIGGEGWESDSELFAKVAVTWNQWIGHSGEHLYAAQVLLPHIEQRNAEVQRLMESQHRGTTRMVPCLTGIYFLHCAFSIENALKCVIASRCAKEIESEARRTKRVPKLLLGHDLVELGTRAGFSIGTDEEYALAFLSRYGTWAGRYPLPVHNSANAVTNKLSDGNHYLMSGYRHDQIPAFVKFCETVYAWARAQVETLQEETPSD
jgi:hypothetical protein